MSSVVGRRRGRASRERRLHEPGTGRGWRWTSGRISGRSGACCSRHCPREGGRSKATRLPTRLGAVIEREPDWSLLDATTPPSLIHLLRRCLTKDAKLRLRDIGEARIALALGGDGERVDTPARWPRSAKAVAALAALLVVSSIAAAVYAGRTPLVTAAATPIQFLVFPPEGGVFESSPGAHLLRAVAGWFTAGLRGCHGSKPSLASRHGQPRGAPGPGNRGRDLGVLVAGQPLLRVLCRCQTETRRPSRRRGRHHLRYLCVQPRAWDVGGRRRDPRRRALRAPRSIAWPQRAARRANC